MTIEITPVTGSDRGRGRAASTCASRSSDVDVKAIHQALLDHLVLFFRDQHIADEQQIAFARNFGPLYVSPFKTVYQETPDIVVLDQVSPKGEGADVWHSDLTFLADAAARLDPAGGADAGGRWRHVLRQHVRRVRRALASDAGVRRRPTVPSTTSPRRSPRPSATATRTMDLAETQEKWPPVEHKVVVTHPDTGRKALYVNRNSTTHIKGLSERENDVLLPFLQDHIRSPEFQCRLHWEEGTVAFWDNRTVQHYARRRLRASAGSCTAAPSRRDAR